MAIVTISRMYGSGGSEIATRVAHELGWDLLDNAVVDAVAARLGLSTEEVEAHEERMPGLVERLARSLTLATPELLPPPPLDPMESTEERVVEVTERIIREAVARGNAVIVGRGAQSILADRADVMHVFCHAPRAALVERVARRRKCERGEAESLVDDTNRHREQYVKRRWQRAWREPSNYDLCVNTAWVGIECSAALIVHAARSRFAQR